MKSIILFFIVALVSLELTCQVTSNMADVIFGDERKVNSKAIKIIHAGGIDDYTILVEVSLINKREIFTVQVYKDLTYIHGMELNLNFGGKMHEFEKIVILDKSLYFFNSYFDKKLKKKFLYYQELIVPDVTPHDKNTLCGQLNNYIDFNNNDFYFIKSRDNQKLTILFDLDSNQPRQKNIDLQVFDSEMNQIWDKPVTFPNKEELTVIRRAEMSDEGSVSLIVQVYDDVYGDIAENQLDYTMYNLLITENGEKLLYMPLSDKSNGYVDVDTYIDSDAVYYAALASTANNVKIDNIRILKYDFKVQEIEELTKFHFTPDNFKGFISKRKLARLDKRFSKSKQLFLYDYRINEFKKVNRDFLFIAEHAYVENTISKESTLEFTTQEPEKYQYNCDNVIILRFSKKGKPKYLNIIPKKQAEDNYAETFNSVYHHQRNGQDYYFFNDNPKNIFHDKTKRIFPWSPSSESTVNMYFRNDDKFRREVLSFMPKNSLVPIPRTFHSVNENEVLFISHKKGVEKIGKILIK